MNKRLLVVTISTVAALLLLIVLFAVGDLDERTFGVAGVAVMVLSSIAFGLALGRSNRDRALGSSAATDIDQKTSRKRYYLAGVLLLWLVLSLWMTRGGPWIPRLIGTSFFSILVIGLLLQKKRG